MALTYQDDGPARHPTLQTSRTTPDALWSALYAVLTLVLTAVPIVGAAYLVTSYGSDAATGGLLLATSMAALAVGPVAARRLVVSISHRLDGRSSRDASPVGSVPELDESRPPTTDPLAADDALGGR